MSLIFDALRKLEREKEAKQAPGVVVVGSVPWAEAPRSRRLALAVGAAVLALAAAAFVLLRPASNAPDPSRPAAPAAATPEAAASPAPVETPAHSEPAPSEAEEPPAPPPIRLSRPPELAAGTEPGASGARPTPPERSAAPAPPAAGREQEAAPTDASPAAASFSDGAQAAQPPTVAPAEGLRLNAISQRDGRPVALINDRLVFEGDSFDGIRVIRIGEAEVELELRGERRVLRF